MFLLGYFLIWKWKLSEKHLTNSTYNIHIFHIHFQHSFNSYCEGLFLKYYFEWIVSWMIIFVCSILYNSALLKQWFYQCFIYNFSLVTVQYVTALDSQLYFTLFVRKHDFRFIKLIEYYKIWFVIRKSV